MDTNLIPMSDQANILVEVGKITFEGLPALRSSIERLVVNMKDVDVNEENIKEGKKLVARVRKEIDALNDERKRVERRYSEPLDEFKRDIKELSELVREAEDYVRDQIRALDEIEREHKFVEIKQLYDLRIAAYDLNDILTFDDWFRREFCNKTFPMTKIELDLVDWLGKVERDLNFLKEQPDSVRLIAAYRTTKDVVAAVEIIEDEKRQYSDLEKKMAELVETTYSTDFATCNKDYKPKGYTFIIPSVNEANTVRSFLTTTGIKFTELK